MQGQSLAAVFIIVGQNQFVIVDKNGIHESIDDFSAIIRVVDIAILVATDPVHDFFLGEFPTFQLKLGNAAPEGVSLLFQFLQAFSGRIRKDALADGLHHIANLCFALLELLFQHRRYSILLFLHDDNGIRNSTYYGIR